MCSAADIKQPVQSTVEYVCVVFGTTVLLFDKDFNILLPAVSCTFGFYMF